MWVVTFMSPVHKIGIGKVENILKGSLDSIPSPSHSNYGRESLLEVKRQNIVDITQVKVVGSNPGYLLKSFLLYYLSLKINQL